MLTCGAVLCDGANTLEHMCSATADGTACATGSAASASAVMWQGSSCRSPRCQRNHFALQCSPLVGEQQVLCSALQIQPLLQPHVTQHYNIGSSSSSSSSSGSIMSPVMCSMLALPQPAAPRLGVAASISSRRQSHIATVGSMNRC
jgi:hypothetical protein